MSRPNKFLLRLPNKNFIPDPALICKYVNSKTAPSCLDFVFSSEDKIKKILYGLTMLIYDFPIFDTYN